MRIVTRPLADPVPILEHHPDLVWLGPDLQLIGFGTFARLDPAVGPDRFVKAHEAFRGRLSELEAHDEVQTFGSGPLMFASFSFDEDSHGSALVVPELVVGCRRGQWFYTSIGDHDPTWLYHPAGTGLGSADRPRYAGSSIPDLEWLEAVDRALELIEDGALEKIVLARDYAVWSKSTFETRRILERLHNRFPECFVFSIDGLVGASPELLVRVRGSGLESVTLAGSARRSTDPAEDARIASELLGSDKDRREHAAAVRSVDEVLSPLADRVFRDPDPVLVDLANVRHLATRFRGTLEPTRSVLDVAGRLHPTAAVGGTPRPAAVEAIRRLEGMDRGRYAAPVGWTSLDGDGEFAIALRCAELSGARARLFAGAGIVSGSLPEAELEETRIKLLAMLQALEVGNG